MAAPFDKFSAEQQGWIVEAARASVAEERAATYRMLEESRAKILTDGGEINEVDRDAFRAIALSIQDKYAKEAGMTQLLEMTRK